MATAVYSGTTFSGGTSGDRITMSDMVDAVSSPLEAVVHNKNQARVSGDVDLKFDMSTSSFADFTNGELFLTSDGVTNGTGGGVELLGDFVIGGTGEANKPFIINSAVKNMYDAFNKNRLIHSTSYALCNSRLIYKSHIIQDIEQPGSRNALILENDRATSEVRFTLIGKPYTADSTYVLPSPTGFKENASAVVYYTLGSNVLVRDLELYDGYVDFRFEGTWAPPTRLLIESQTWAKMAGVNDYTVANPLVFGTADESFDVKIGESGQTGSYLLMGIRTTDAGNEGLVVTLNFSGLSWNDKMAVFRNNSLCKFENHLVMDGKIVDVLGSGISSADIVFDTKRPVYGEAVSPATVSYDTDYSISVTSDVSGEFTIGTDTGTGDYLSIEAFYSFGSGGNVDNAYANSSHPLAAYDSNTALSYSVFSFGKEIIFKADYTVKKAGDDGDGKQSFGNIQLNADLSVVSADVGSVPTTITDAESLYDNSHKYSIQNKIDRLMSRDLNDIDLGSYDFEVDATAGTLFSFDGSKITIKCTELTANVTTTGNITLLNGASINGTYTDASGTVNVLAYSINNLVASSRIQLYNVTTDSEILNEVIAGTSLSNTYIEGVDISTDDIMRLRVTNVQGLVGYSEYSAVSTAGESGFSFLVAQTICQVYTDLGIDGSTVTNFTADYTNDEVDIIVASDYTAASFYAWWAYNLYSEEGVREFFGGVTAPDEGNFRINNSIVNILLDNTTSTNVAQQDNRRIYREDDARPVKEPTTGGGGVDVEWRSPVLIANSDYLNDKITEVNDSQLGNWEMTGDQLIMKKVNGDLLKTFNLFDKTGNPTTDGAFKREGI